MHLAGTHNEICNALKLICTGYPKDIIFNMETKIIQGKFLIHKNTEFSVRNKAVNDSIEKAK